MIKFRYKRKPSIFQKQIDDFNGNELIEDYDMSNSTDYNRARKKHPKLFVKKHEKKKKTIKHPKSQKKIIDFIEWVPNLRDKYLYRFPKVKIMRYEEFAEEIISKKEWDLLRPLYNYQGSFENLFEFNDFSFFDDLQERLEAGGISCKGMFIKDLFAYELLRINFGCENYSVFERICHFMAVPPLFKITIDPCFLPSAADLSHVLNKIPSEALFDYFQCLVQECMDYGIIVPRILIWDGQFIRSNCSNNKEKDKEIYNDPDAGYCRHNGVKKGVGYDPGILYAYMFDRWFPVYFKMFPGNRSDHVAFKETAREFLNCTPYKWWLIISDSGSYAEKILEEFRFKGMVPIIRARKNIKNQPVKELKKGYYFNTDFIPPDWSEEFFLKIYSFRPMIEEGNSFNNTFYNGSRMNTRGKEAATKLRAIIYILVLLKALTAYKIGRPDLIMTPTAFMTSKYLNFQLLLPILAEKAGFQIFNDKKEETRHN